MTDTPPAPDAELLNAVETLVARLEREQAWAVELRDDLAHTEREIARLLTACDGAIHALPQGHRSGLLLRCARIRLGPDKPGRPVVDPRYSAILDYVAVRPDEEVRNAEIRAHLRRHGLPADAQYVTNVLSRWASEGMLTRTAFGCYRVNGQDPRLRKRRMKPASDSQRAAVRAEIADGRAAAEARFEDARARKAAEEAAEEEARKVRAFERLRRENFYNPPSEWNPNHPDYKGDEGG